jgi:hypothetical protein
VYTQTHTHHTHTHTHTHTHIIGELSELVDAEVSLLQGLVSGNGVSDHMEDAYFVALRNALSGPDTGSAPSNLA